MRNNLSAQIKLTRIPTHYYRANDPYEYAAITRFEKIPTEVVENIEEASRAIGQEFVEAMTAKSKMMQPFVVALNGSSTLLPIFQELIRRHKQDKISFNNLIVFNISEFYPLDNPTQSHATFSSLKVNFLDHIDIQPCNIFSPSGMMEKSEINEFCRQYELKIASFGGLDLSLIAISTSGALGINEPGSQISTLTRLVLLGNESRKKISKQFNDAKNIPTCAITMGLSTITSAKRVILPGFGEIKSAIMKQTIEGGISDTNPASFLQLHKNTQIYLDLSAAEQLTRISHPWLVTNCEWNEQLTRRAIVWLCNLTGKSILKLTNKDYIEHGLSELVALYGSAYNVNIAIFNDLQHTITGWPGGKPNADDTNRPERANPYPKKVLVFSPHPDDDVISMGGTFIRLVEQGHDVHIAYQTSGNIAVGDEEVIRYSYFLEGIKNLYKLESQEFNAHHSETQEFLLHSKQEGDMDTPHVRFLKGLIRQGEARSACNYMGVKSENIHFLALPFYETGAIKKGDLSLKDVDIIKTLLQEVEPDQIFAAGDLADPHGTHKVCLDAVLAAIDELKGEKWLDNCRIWMYRGAWAEWEMDHIEMAVPMSPEQLRQKRNAILKHQSQMEGAPFLGNDERLFWQRSEDRNRATAAMYNKLGLADYEAIEAFVEYKPL